MRLGLLLWYMLLAVVAVLAYFSLEAAASPGQYCTSTAACAPHELCVTADPWANAGTCQKLKLLP